jgi:TRAP-type C4-dicarboxylate transport system permease small subunit
MGMLQRISYRLAKSAAYLSAVIFIYMVLHILVEIVLRVFFSRSTYVLDEFVGYATASVTFLCLAYALHDGALIRVEMLLQHVGKKARHILELFSVSLTLAVIGTIIYFFWTKTFWRDITRGTRSESIAEIPLWIPEGLAFVGLLLFALQLLTMLLQLVFKPKPQS